jgi:hypothetical protein
LIDVLPSRIGGFMPRATNAFLILICLIATIPGDATPRPRHVAAGADGAYARSLDRPSSPLSSLHSAPDQEPDLAWSEAAEEADSETEEEGVAESSRAYLEHASHPDADSPACWLGSPLSPLHSTTTGRCRSSRSPPRATPLHASDRA